ncbi:P-loop containing nucleoside triphosphate hydrolase protein [Decorospora gaudefroyi]|uniref:P-loop containing nucleoside triphosphate hydrolase protein n=1 Tax=Decorospora gaudefroyi TaxID=184978 RepID=A0A6A5K3W2_9PLEO|nr:P-loop containing nucleoside triphosphate hydrolase protein [Decorospora gaudefroyi]
MSLLSPNPRYICGRCIRNVLRNQTTLLTRPQSRRQSTTPDEEDATPDRKLRIRRLYIENPRLSNHGKGRAPDEYGGEPPERSARTGLVRLTSRREQAGKRPANAVERSVPWDSVELEARSGYRVPLRGKQIDKTGMEDSLVPYPSSHLSPKPKSEPEPAVLSELPKSYVKIRLNMLEDFNWYWESLPPTIAQKMKANHFFTKNAKTAKFIQSVAQFRLFPESAVPEVAFVGRSNVGKSSLLNALVNADMESLLARTSATPGFTTTMNLYGIGQGIGVTMIKRPEGHDKIVGTGGLTIVDMPGYGEGSLASWGVEIMKYIQSRKQLRRVFVLINAEHGIKDKDRSLLASLRLAGVSHQVILSKMDKVYIPKSKLIRRFGGNNDLRTPKPKGTPEELRQVMEKIKEEIQPPVGGGALGEILAVSAMTTRDGKGLGIDHLRYAVLKAVGLDDRRSR